MSCVSVWPHAGIRRAGAVDRVVAGGWEAKDFYVSVMVGMPVPLVAVERARLRRAVVDASRSTGRWSR